jgi:TonB family protein
MDTRTPYAYLKPQPVVWLTILASAGLHLVLVGLVVMFGLGAESGKSLKEKALVTRLVRKGKKLPENWLPHKAQRPTPKAAPVKPAPTDVATKAPAPKKPTPPRPGKVDYSTDMDSALAALGNSPPKKTLYEQEGDPDGIVGGDALIAEKGNEYLTKVFKAVKSKYEVPNLIPARERLLLKVLVAIYVDSRGRLIKIEFEQRSGNHLFDSAVERTIRRAAPFPAPPKELAREYANEGIGLQFDGGNL